VPGSAAAMPPFGTHRAIAYVLLSINWMFSKDGTEGGVAVGTSSSHRRLGHKRRRQG
jgi:hypothetical protein